VQLPIISNLSEGAVSVDMETANNRNIIPTGKEPTVKKGSVSRTSRLNPLASHQSSVEKLSSIPSPNVTNLQGTKLTINTKTSEKSLLSLPN
jgi:hypothetical protein